MKIKTLVPLKDDSHDTDLFVPPFTILEVVSCEDNYFLVEFDGRVIPVDFTEGYIIE